MTHPPDGDEIPGQLPGQGDTKPLHPDDIPGIPPHAEDAELDDNESNLETEEEECLTIEAARALLFSKKDIEKIENWKKYDILSDDNEYLEMMKKLPSPHVLFADGKEPTIVDLVNNPDFDFHPAVAQDLWDDLFRLKGKGKWLKRIQGDRATYLPGRCKDEEAVIKWYQEFKALFQQGLLRKPPSLSVKELLALNPKDAKGLLLGEGRWLNQGGSCLWIGESGIGKSVLTIQAAVSWCLGRAFFGVMPKRQLKSLIIQSENDEWDNQEIIESILKGLDIISKDSSVPWSQEQQQHDARLLEHVNQYVRFEGWDSTDNPNFTKTIRALIDEHRPDLVWLDPLLGFVDGDLADQAVVSPFLRKELAPLARETRICWMIAHHTGKPPRKGFSGTKSTTDYFGFGSSEFTNWARAIVTLFRMGPAEANRFELKFGKRGDRAGSKRSDGTPAREIYLKHRTEKDYLFWEELPLAAPKTTASVSGIFAAPAAGVKAKFGKGGATKFSKAWPLDDFIKMYDPKKSESENKKYITENLKAADGSAKKISGPTYSRRLQEYKATLKP